MPPNRTLGHIREDGTIQDASYRTLGYIAKSGLVQGSDYSTQAHIEGTGWDPSQVAAFWFFFRKAVTAKP